MVKPIPGFEGIYSISEHGEVVAHERIRIRSNPKKPEDKIRYKYKKHILKPNEIGTHKQYHRVRLVDKKGKFHYILIHRLVCKVFNGDFPNEYEVDHKDNNPTNNHYTNLIALTKKEHTYKSVECDDVVFGNNHGNSKINEEQAKEIKKFLKDSNLTQKEISSTLGISYFIVKDIARGKTWRRVG